MKALVTALLPLLLSCQGTEGDLALLVSPRQDSPHAWQPICFVDRYAAGSCATPAELKERAQAQCERETLGGALSTVVYDDVCGMMPASHRAVRFVCCPKELAGTCRATILSDGTTCQDEGALRRLAQARCSAAGLMPQGLIMDEECGAGAFRKAQVLCCPQVVRVAGAAVGPWADLL